MTGRRALAASASLCSPHHSAMSATLTNDLVVSSCVFCRDQHGAEITMTIQNADGTATAAVIYI